ncbi:hypothetical protein [Streptomyces sp. NPDC001828]|uniref:hypothetical protein n=1 Tax=Streptomyces sp. NPDC001828 TaxID=3364615 RepID=UPI0036899305
MAATPPTTGRRRGPRLGFGLIGPRHGRHILPTEQLDALALPIGDDGVAVGVDAEGRPAVLGVSRPTAYDIVLIGGLWTAQVLALRAAAAGMRVAVETGRPQAWERLTHTAADRNGMSVHGVDRVPPLGASAGEPVLVVRDCGMRPPRGRVASAPWQAVLTLLPYVGPVAPRLVRQARLVGVQRVSPDEAAQLGRILNLPRTERDGLPTLADGMTLWCDERERSFAMTQATDTETGLLGKARRID